MLTKCCKSGCGRPSQGHQSAVTRFSPVVLISDAQAQPEHQVPDGDCFLQFENSVQLHKNKCMKGIFLARDSLGQYLPYYDELATVTVTSPSNVTNCLNIIRWQPDCANGSCSTVTIYQNPNDLVNGNIDITNLFTDECGNFTISIVIKNK